MMKTLRALYSINCSEYKSTLIHEDLEGYCNLCRVVGKPIVETGEEFKSPQRNCHTKLDLTCCNLYEPVVFETWTPRVLINPINYVPPLGTPKANEDEVPKRDTQAMSSPRLAVGVLGYGPDVHHQHSMVVMHGGNQPKVSEARGPATNKQNLFYPQSTDTTITPSNYLKLINA